MAQLIKPQIKWTVEKIEFLRKEYPLGDKDKLAESLGLTRKSLKYAAARFKVKSLKPRKKLSYSKLLEESNEAWYWQGFIMGDGHIRPSGVLSITLSEKDKGHLENLNKFIPNKIKDIKSETTYAFGNYCLYKMYDVDTALKFLHRYKLTGPKTYNPPDLSCLDSCNKFLSFFMGLFDADGCIGFNKSKNVSSLKIEVHLNWKSVLETIQTKLKTYLNVDSTVRETSRGYVKLMIFKFDFIKLLKETALELNLPYLERKWSNVNLNYICKKHIMENSLDSINKMISGGFNWTQIADVLGLKENTCRRRYRELTKNK